MMDDRDRDVPIIMHIGPHKTGTTTLQAGLGQNRSRLREQGVIYPGRLNHELNPATAVTTGIVEPGQDVRIATDHWLDMLAEIRSSGGRLGVLSSEFYAETPTARIGWLMEQLGHQAEVVITLRSLARILISQWQQYIQNRIDIGWEDWLTAILAKPEPGRVTPSFWMRHRHDRLVRRWLEFVGPERLTVIAVDENDPAFVLRSFEQILGVQPGSLTPRNLRANRSLTLEEVELVRRFNQLYTSVGLKSVDYTALIRYGAVRHLQRQPIAPGSHSIRMPDWAIERTTGLARMMIDDITATGVKVVGPIADLGDPARMPARGSNPPVTDVTVDLAADLAAGVIDAMDRYRPAGQPDPVNAPVLTATLGRTQSAELASLRAEVNQLRGSIQATNQAIRAQRLAGQADRRELLAELYRRVRRRARRLADRSPEA